jgi:AraC-like DNA-binding protein
VKKGLKSDNVFPLIGLSTAPINVMEQELTIDHLHKLTLLTKEQIGLENCGLKMSEKLNFNNTGLFGPYALSCSTLNDVFFRIYNLQKNICGLFSFLQIHDNYKVSIVYDLDCYWEIKYPESAGEIIDFAIASGLQTIRNLTDQRIVPLKVDLMRKKPCNSSIYEMFFDCPVFFNRDANRIEYSSEVFNYRIPTFNSVLLDIIDDYLSQEIEDIGIDRDFLFEVKRIIVCVSQYKIPTEEDVLSQLKISRSSLQKKLKENNSTFKQLREQVQKEMSLDYLKSGMNIKEVAWTLGYNDVGNFYRAFRRWTGKSPKEIVC